MRQWTLRKTVEFDAAHRLPDHPGKCANLHGHRWRVTVETCSGTLDSQGMVLDFGAIKAVVMDLDHKTILAKADPLASALKEHGQDVVELAEPPTAEHLARHLHWLVSRRLRAGSWLKVSVEESPGSLVEYEAERE